MSLIEQIQQAAVDSDSDLGQVLRLCKILAARLDSRPLEEWLSWESNGYPKEADLPNYRVFPLILKGHFTGAFGSALRFAPIPAASIPKAIRESVTRFHCRQSVSAIADIIKPRPGSLRAPLQNMAPYLGTSVYSDMNCLDVWGEFSDSQLVEVLNSVRNRVLDFVLALWKEHPNAGEPVASDKKIKSDQVSQIFHTTVYGGAANVVGAGHHSTLTFSIQSGDFRALEQTLREKGVEPADLAALQQAINDDPKPVDASKFGPRVANWIGNMLGKAASGMWGMTVETGGALLTSALAKYYGLEP